MQTYRPDFLIRLTNGRILVLKVKGRDSQQNEYKRGFLAEWVQAVNEQGVLGHRPGMCRTIRQTSATFWLIMLTEQAWPGSRRWRRLVPDAMIVVARALSGASARARSSPQLDIRSLSPWIQVGATWQSSTVGGLAQYQNIDKRLSRPTYDTSLVDSSLFDTAQSCQTACAKVLGPTHP